MFELGKMTDCVSHSPAIVAKCVTDVCSTLCIKEIKCSTTHLFGPGNDILFSTYVSTHNMDYNTHGAFRSASQKCLDMQLKSTLYGQVASDNVNKMSGC